MKIKMLLLKLVIVLLIVGCQAQPILVEDKIRPVEVVSARVTTRQTLVEYYGYVVPESIKKYAFATGGVIQETYFAPGDSVKPGDTLAKVVPDKLNIAVNTASQQEAVAKLQVQKAQTALDYLEKAVADTKGLYLANAATKQQLDEVAFKRDLALKDLDLAKGQLVQAQLQGKYQRENRSDAIMVSEVNGIVAQVLSKPGELIGAGYPIYVIKSIDNVISVGMTAEDVRLLKIGDEAIAADENRTWQAKVVEISVLPDEKTRTYEVKYALFGDHQPLVGELIKLQSAGLKQEGIWLPVNAILNDGLDFVYVVEDGRALRKNITLGDRVVNEVNVVGLNPGDQLIVKGSASLSHGYQVKVVEGSDE